MKLTEFEEALAEARRVVGTARVRNFFKYATRFGKPTDAVALRKLIELYKRRPKI